MKKITFLLLLILGGAFAVSAQTNYDFSQMQREKLGRGLIGVRQSNTRVFLTWRYLSSDPLDVTFNIYKNDKFVRNTAKTSAIDQDYTYKVDASYKVIPVIDGIEQEDIAGEYTVPGNSPVGYLEIPLEIPEGGTTLPYTVTNDKKVESYPDGQDYTYSANDCSVGDLDGDGEYEIIVKWDPSNSRDNSHRGYTGDIYIDAYKLNGTFLWRIALGKNIRAGAHYTQFLVYDFDGDGKAEIIMKTSDGTIDGTGKVIGDATKDYRKGGGDAGLILTGNEYLTIFNGETGAAMQTIDYIPVRGNTNDWGDNYGNRSERYLACTAYLDGKNPSAVMCRGYYSGKSGGGRTVLAAWDWDGKNLTNKWTFDTKNNLSSYIGQGNHNLRVGDIDGDGCDEIVYGQMAVNNDGTPFYNTRLGHGDAMHMTVFDPEDGGLAVWACHEDADYGSTFRDAATGKILFQIKSGDDVGRCMAADVDPTRRGVEMWSSRSGGLRDIKGNVIRESTSGLSMNMAAWWDGGLLRNLQDDVSITKYNYERGGSTVLLNAQDCSSNNSTKKNPCLVADMYGDWREELLVRTSDNTKLRLYISSTDTIDYRFHTFLEDPVYRSSVAYQNVAYNQPTNTGFYFGADLGTMLTESYTDGQWSLNAGMSYDAYEWLLDGEVVGTERLLSLPVDGLLSSENKGEVVLKSTFRGYVFEEKAQFSSLNSIADNIASVVRISEVVNEQLEIELPELNSDVRVVVYSMNGMLMEEITISVGTTFAQIEAVGWSKGIYLVKLVLSDSSFTRKVVKN